MLVDRQTVGMKLKELFTNKMVVYGLLFNIPLMIGNSSRDRTIKYYAMLFFLINVSIIILFEGITWLKNHHFTQEDKRAIYNGLLFGLFGYTCFLLDLTFSIIGWSLFGINTEGDLQIRGYLEQGIFFNQYIIQFLVAKILLFIVMFIAGFTFIYNHTKKLKIIYWTSWIIGVYISFGHFTQANYWILFDLFIITKESSIIIFLIIEVWSVISFILILRFFISLSDILSWNKITC